jgi:hypothetical protein
VNQKSFPTELAGNDVTTMLRSEGWFLTLGSLFRFTSVVIGPPMPSSLCTANPVIEHPPLLKGLSQLIEIDVRVEATYLGLGDPDGGIQAFTSRMGERAPSPLKFSAETEN